MPILCPHPLARVPGLVEQPVDLIVIYRRLVRPPHPPMATLSGTVNVPELVGREINAAAQTARGPFSKATSGRLVHARAFISP
jgi:hypothetical protein